MSDNFGKKKKNSEASENEIMDDAVDEQVNTDTSDNNEPKSDKNKKKKKKTTKQMLIGLLIKIAVIVLAVWLVLTFVLSINIHYGNNMFPAVRDGDLIIGLRLQGPYLNAPVLYEYDNKMCLGRVVGMPGNVIDISDKGELTVNGTAPAEEVFYPTYRDEASDISYPYTVGDDEVFILNDFRTDTLDSRSFGAVSVNKLKGPILLMIRRRGF